MKASIQQKLAILGHPVGHSLSPLMHTTAFKLAGLECTYEAIDVESKLLAKTVKKFREENYLGWNVTIPYKEQILSFLDHVDETARTPGAVNTVHQRNGRLTGYNTDVIGVYKSLETHKKSLEAMDAVIIGAGGAARAALSTLNNHFKMHHLTLAVRSIERGRDLVSSLKLDRSANVVGLFSDDLNEFIARCSLLINTTPVGMYPNSYASPLPDEIPLHANQFVMDLIYRPLETTLLKKAKSCGATIVTGLEMFLHQGAASFEIWTGKKMPVEDVRQALLRALTSDELTPSQSPS